MEGREWGQEEARPRPTPTPTPTPTPRYVATAGDDSAPSSQSAAWTPATRAGRSAAARKRPAWGCDLPRTDGWSGASAHVAVGCSRITRSSSLYRGSVARRRVRAQRFMQPRPAEAKRLTLYSCMRGRAIKKRLNETSTRACAIIRTITRTITRTNTTQTNTEEGKPGKRSETRL